MNYSLLIRTCFWFVIPFLFFECQPSVIEKKPESPFENTPQTFPITLGPINEASGIADSKKLPGYIWVNEDSGNPSQLSLISHDGKVFKTVHIKGTTNRDWEDLALSDGPVAGKSYLYIADIGDNNGVFPSYTIYRMEEPGPATDTVYTYDQISFQYPDGSHDAEAIFVDPSTKDIYLITKREIKSKVYKLSYPQTIGSLNIAAYLLDLPYNGVVSAAVEPGGNGIIIKTYTTLNYYKKNAGESLFQALQHELINVLYTPEPQGEAICFAGDNSGFFTLSEKGLASSVNLFFYRRK